MLDMQRIYLMYQINLISLILLILQAERTNPFKSFQGPSGKPESEVKKT